ncbi:cellulose binding domain-containing protein [Phytohabitans kaempferiae]|uniref:Cellulose binding domain-containing protein n=1 Tax=Phytohabitans kaempferiae TaxID=1620943 RepID=A0ABV6LW56_9ACTN
MKPHIRRTKTLALTAFCGLIAGATLTSTPARAAALFSDDFEQPTVNVWLTGGGGSWSVTADGSKVFTQASTTADTLASAGSGSGSGTLVSARAKATSALSPDNLVSLAGKVSDPSNLYYVGFRGPNLEIGQRKWGQNVVLASTPFAASAGSWYTLSLSFLESGKVTGRATGPGDASATVSAADPGGTRSGDRVGFYTESASASFDDIRLRDELPPPTPPTGPCPVKVAIKPVVVTAATTFATFSLTNLSPASIAPPWTMTWRFPNGQLVGPFFNANFHQIGPVVTVTSVPWFPAIPPGTTTALTVGFHIANPLEAPSEVTFNGHTNCAVTLS